MIPFPISERAPVTHAGPLPEAVDVVVIGGGVIGTMTAFYLAQRGQSVLLAEKGRIAGEQSSRNWGWVRQQGREPAELPIMIEANRLWRELSESSGRDLGLQQTGIMYLARDQATMAKYEGWLDHARQHQLDSRLVTRDEVASMMPSAQGDWVGGLWTASDLRAEPWIAVPALAQAAAEAGATVRETLAVRRVETTAGKVSAVVTEAGTVRTSRVVLAAGAWSSLFLRAHGASIPQLSVRASVCATEPLPEIFAGAAGDDVVDWRRRADGGYTIAGAGLHELFIGPDAFRAFRAFLPQLRSDPFGTMLWPMGPRDFPDSWNTPRQWSGDAVTPFERMRVLNPKPNMRKLRKLIAAFGARFPVLGEIRMKAAWGGMIDTMPDMVPVVDHVPELPGLIVATGMSGHGFGIGPGFGRVLADMAMDRAPGYDMSRFRYARFTDGSPVDIGPLL